MMPITTLAPQPIPRSHNSLLPMPPSSPSQSHFITIKGLKAKMSLARFELGNKGNKAFCFILQQFCHLAVLTTMIIGTRLAI